jgi:hypothetical protein
MAGPLRGNLGQTHYTRIHPTGELATAGEADLLPRDVLADKVIDTDVLPMDGDPTPTALDDGALVARQSFEACVVRSWSL